MADREDYKPVAIPIPGLENARDNEGRKILARIAISTLCAMRCHNIHDIHLVGEVEEELGVIMDAWETLGPAS